MNKLVTIFSLLIIIINCNAQDDIWNGKKCAVVLTYDDCLNVHLDKVVPVLDSLGFKGTFYVQGNSYTLNKRMEDWREISKKGHELGNHTLFHPCTGDSVYRKWVETDYDLRYYSVRRIVDEIRTENVLLKAIDGKDKRTFAYTCGDKEAGDSNFTGLIQQDFTGARSVASRMEKFDEINLFDIGSYMMYNTTADSMINLVKQAEENNTLLVFLFHGVGGEHNLNVDLNEHNKLLYYLKQNEKDIWITSMVNLTEYIKVH